MALQVVAESRDVLLVLTADAGITARAATPAQAMPVPTNASQAKGIDTDRSSVSGFEGKFYHGRAFESRRVGGESLTVLFPVHVERPGAEATMPAWPRAILAETTLRA